ncbi:MAG: hypothetical protein HW396_715 [Candidatus Dadabacteria bacterium]|nr:hypothetical protein [Candidatus Dadabacteria bacterium]
MGIYSDEIKVEKLMFSTVFSIKLKLRVKNIAIVGVFNPD